MIIPRQIITPSGLAVASDPRVKECMSKAEEIHGSCTSACVHSRPFNSSVGSPISNSTIDAEFQSLTFPNRSLNANKEGNSTSGVPPEGMVVVYNAFKIYSCCEFEG